MYMSGIPAGMLVDGKGPRLAIIIGSISLFCGYYPIYLGLSPRTVAEGFHD